MTNGRKGLWVWGLGCFLAMAMVPALPLMAALDGIPEYNPPLDGTDVETWWSTIAFNPDSPNYETVINSPTNEVYPASGTNLGAAVDAIKSTGGTIILADGGSYTAFDEKLLMDLPGHIHVIAPNNATIDGSFSYSGMDRSYADCGLGMTNHDPYYIDRVPTRPRNFYVKNVTFDFGGSMYACAGAGVWVRDMVFENCTFQNNNRRTDYGDQGSTWANMLTNNIWWIGCNFLGYQNWCAYVEGAQTTGFVNCTVPSDYYSGCFEFFTNDDMTTDLNENGIWEANETRNPKYVAIYGNTFGNAGGTYYATVLEGNGGHFLLKNNVMEGGYSSGAIAGYGASFMAAQVFTTRKWSTLTYDGHDIRIIGNTIGNVHSVMKVCREPADLSPQDVDGIRDECAMRGWSCGGVSTFGEYEVRCNVVDAPDLNSVVSEFLYDSQGIWSIDGPNLIDGNCVNDPGCTPTNCSATNTVATPIFSPDGGNYGSAQSVTMTCSTSGATIYYTTDGSDPDETDTAYSSPVAVGSDMTLKARAYATDMDPSAIKSATYVIDTQSPSAPTLSLGTVTAESVALSWSGATDDHDVTGYTVYRDAGSIGTTDTGNYSDDSVSACNSYSYTVTALDAAGNESNPSNEVVADTLANPQTADLNVDGDVDIDDLQLMAGNWLGTGCGTTGDIDADEQVDMNDFSSLVSHWGETSQWECAAIGGAIEGSCTDNGDDSMTVEGAGADIVSTSDAFQFMYQPMTGDCELIARVASIENTHDWAKAGVMIRNTLDAGSYFAMTYMTPDTYGVQYLIRSESDPSGWQNGDTSPDNPHWVRIVRSGDSFTSYHADDNAGSPGSWQQISDAKTITMNTTVYVGLAVCSHSAGNLCTAEFDSVSLVQN